MCSNESVKMAKKLLDVMYDEKIKSDLHRFGPDYYAKQASSPSGARLKSPEDKELVWPAVSPEEETQEVAIILSDESYIHNNQEDEVFEINTIKSAISPLEAKVFGIPKISQSDTSDTDLSIINYYDVENSQVYKSKGTTLDVNSNSPNEVDKHYSVTSETGSEIISTEPPMSRDRPRYIKLNSSRARSVTPKINFSELKRHKSETDLQNSFDAPPKVISRKKDNTLISRIYSNPHVRSFALSSRHQLPIEDDAVNIKNQNRYNGKRTLYNSDEGISSRLSASSSIEYLLDLDNKSNIYVPATTRNYQVKSVSSEDDLLSDQTSKNHSYSLNEDLLSFTINENPHHKKDNTIISKIYQDQKVRNFALSTRLYSTGHDSTTVNKPSELKIMEQNQPLSIGIPTQEVVVSEEISQNEQNLLSPANHDIEELTKKKIVHCILDQIAKLDPKLSITTNKSAEGDEEINISVKALRKKFENNDAKNPVMSSLTARSLSKQMREHLRN